MSMGVVPFMLFGVGPTPTNPSDLARIHDDDALQSSVCEMPCHIGEAKTFQQWLQRGIADQAPTPGHTVPHGADRLAREGNFVGVIAWHSVWQFFEDTRNTRLRSKTALGNGTYNAVFKYAVRTTEPIHQAIQVAKSVASHTARKSRVDASAGRLLRLEPEVLTWLELLPTCTLRISHETNVESRVMANLYELWLTMKLGSPFEWPGSIPPGPFIYKGWISALSPSTRVDRVGGMPSTEKEILNLLLQPGRGTVRPALAESYSAVLAESFAGDLDQLINSTTHLGVHVKNQIHQRIKDTAAAGITLLDIKPGNMLYRAYNAAHIKPPNVWDATQFGTEYDIRLTDFGVDFSAYMPTFNPKCAEFIMLTLMEGHLQTFHMTTAFLPEILDYLDALPTCGARIMLSTDRDRQHGLPEFFKDNPDESLHTDFGLGFMLHFYVFGPSGAHEEDKINIFEHLVEGFLRLAPKTVTLRDARYRTDIPHRAATERLDAFGALDSTRAAIHLSPPSVAGGLLHGMEALTLGDGERQGTHLEHANHTSIRTFTGSQPLPELTNRYSRIAPAAPKLENFAHLNIAQAKRDGGRETPLIIGALMERVHQDLDALEL